MKRRYDLADVRTAYKGRDAWWTVLLVDPYTARLVQWTANHTSITPNQLTLVSLAFGLGAAASFLQASRGWLLVGALLYHLSFVADCMDGKIARLKGTGSIFGSWLDYMFDRVRVIACSICLMTGQYRVTDDVLYLYLAFVVITLDMMRYMNALQVYKLRQMMAERIGGTAPPASMGADPIEQTAPPPLQETFSRRHAWYFPIRDRLKRARIRPHLFSGVEFQMFVFIGGPLLDQIPAVVVVSSALLLAFELVIIYKLRLSTMDFRTKLAVGEQDVGDR